MIDEDGYRANVAIVLTNSKRHVFWAGRVNRRGWQFPQGGILDGETAEQAMYRELEEEIGLQAADVEVLGHTDDWLRYRLPKRFQRTHSEPLCVGQKQRWFLLRLVGEENFRFDTGTSPEFDRWCWVDFWYPVRNVIFFKRRVYKRALSQLAPLLFKDDIPERGGSKRRSPVRRTASP
ncbi:MAG: RNA pyrophosphohydrolase [Gammaproteobacteria bacterium]|nr:RNA pyrophosphohydrolase [Gammaproteobacteria bacterium]